MTFLGKFVSKLILRNKSELLMQETGFWALSWEDPLEKGMATQSGILAWEIHGQKSLAGYSPWGCKESDMTEQLKNNSKNK